MLKENQIIEVTKCYDCPLAIFNLEDLESNMCGIEGNEGIFSEEDGDIPESCPLKIKNVTIILK